MTTQYDLFRSAGAALGAGLDAWAGRAARHHACYRLGRTSREVRAAVQQMLAEAERRPFPVAGTPADAPVVRLLFRQLIQHQEYDGSLASWSATCPPRRPGTWPSRAADLSALLAPLSSLEPADSLVTADIRSHGVYGRGMGLTPVQCADRLVNGYLETGRLPAGDVECAGEGARSRRPREKASAGDFVHEVTG